VALDPKFASAWARLSLARSMAVGNGASSPELGPASLAAAEQARALAPERPDGFYALGVYYRAVRGDYARGAEVLRQGLERSPDDVDLLRNLGYAEGELGRLEAALTPIRRATSLDPRAWQNYVALAETLTLLRRPREAREAVDRGLALSPTNLTLIESRVRTHLQEGDLAAARAFLDRLPEGVDPTELVAAFAYWNDAWVLDDARRDLLLRLTPAAFGGNRGEWAHALASEEWQRGHLEEARRYAEEARKSFAEAAAKTPDDPAPHEGLGAALALLGRDEEAVREGECAVALVPVEKLPNDWSGSALKYLAYIHTRLGHQEEAIDVLEKMLKHPYRITRAWLRIDPNFAPLRGNPRFEKLAAESP